MQSLLTIIHLVICAALIGLVLLQRGKGAEVGVAMGSGASNTVFGSEGAGGFLSRATAYLGIAFFVVCLTMTKLSFSTHSVVDTALVSTGAVQESAPAGSSEIPD